MTTAIVDTSTANIASVRYALERLGARYRLTETPEEAQECDRIILPGVGAAGPAMKRLIATGWAQALRKDQRPLLGVCLGMQLLYDYSAESDCEMLGLIPGRIERLDPGADGPWPHMGWNTLTPVKSDEPLLEGVPAGAHVYFVHGFYAPIGAHTAASTQYGTGITAIARKGHVAGCQFHPERSAKTGAQILTNFVKGAA
ncbi:MAG: imidazole glycerol phosphate synthase subunit HisH [Oceanicaulis sp.]|uniref:imidazole glycerol phosphate synthase subunit HisH n=1 Tax=unclassified Oceanicaulis TaxID=2632123 RepID=UPI000C4067B8|nr:MULTISPECIES: imidazole glycerol phosphate synthase subunit HisH [unclassified Oceanicaulis]MAB70467.1 imidazole glycerol phosphate synthase subunit HisH [Oceanicaulis sp.]MBC38445.1 imidazole glycerol phosphate synthase subunit HisH [Oceanicaulis sp.]MBG35466.1 imidazole glycerol phosphate synthase subunit HisH [Oceanicaulis sp.]HBU61818.1 imidazole glycerol phosphate synthase subunit HisH [Oceanicaulis sp.]HCR93617.1 imidazole glycerol phosphate synthase subunit HisH [Oceanicaulis sp.]